MSANNTVETQVVIHYDVYGNRLEEDVWTPSAGWTTTRFAYDAWDPRTPSGTGNENWKVWATLDGNNNLVTRYINGDVLDQVFAQISAGGTVAWYLTDRLGSTRALVDNNGNVLDVITYDAWGNITSQTNPTPQPLFMFTGIAYDAMLGLYFNGNGRREYDPETGRFIEQDPTQFRAGDSNLYRYVGNDPTNVLDPSGLEDTWDAYTFFVEFMKGTVLEPVDWSSWDNFFSSWLIGNLTSEAITYRMGCIGLVQLRIGGIWLYGSQVEWYSDLKDAVKRAKGLGSDARIIAMQYKGVGNPDWTKVKDEKYPSHIQVKVHPEGNHATWHQPHFGPGFWEWLGPDGWGFAKGNYYTEAKKRWVRHNQKLPKLESEDEAKNGMKTFTAYGVVAVLQHKWRPAREKPLNPTEGPTNS